MNKKRPLVSLIAAIDKNNLIGNAGKIPWIIPGELKRFKEVTMGKPIVMGRKTHESIGRVLVGRDNIVLSSNKLFNKEGLTVYDNFENIIKDYIKFPEIMVIGGSEIYNLAMPYAQKLYITHIDKVYEGDTWFPKIDLLKWNVSNQKDFFNEASNTNYSIKVYTRFNE